jgi:hypothetical protein
LSSEVSTTRLSDGLLDKPYGLALEADGDIVTANAVFDGWGRVVRTDPDTGAQATVSSGGHFRDPMGIAVEADGDILVVDMTAFMAPGWLEGPGGVIRVDPDTGSWNEPPEDTTVCAPVGLALEADGDILVSERGTLGGTGAVIRVDPQTGAQTEVSTRGSFVTPFAIADGSFEFAPHADYHGPDSFTYKAGDSQPATVSLTVASVNDLPETAIALAPEAAGWHTSTVGVNVSATDRDDAVAQTRCALDPADAPQSYDDLPAEPCSLTSVSADGEHTIYAASVDGAGATDTPVKRSFKLDATAPTITYSGHDEVYDVDATVDIACDGGDATSGIDVADCASLRVPAYELALGTNELTATATDVAGNMATASTSFEVRVTAGGLCRLTTRFVQDSARYRALSSGQRAIADRLAAELCRGLAALAPHLSATQKALLIRAYEKGVGALAASELLTAEQAATLQRLAGRL